MQESDLGWARAVGHRAADAARCLLGQRVMHGRAAGGGERQKRHAEPPREVLLGRAVQLDRQQPRVLAREQREHRLAQHTGFVEQTEVGVVAQNDHPAPLFRGRDQRIAQRGSFGLGRRIARRVVREVERHNQLALRGRLRHRIGESRRIETAGRGENGNFTMCAPRRTLKTML